MTELKKIFQFSLESSLYFFRKIDVDSCWKLGHLEYTLKFIYFFEY